MTHLKRAATVGVALDRASTLSVSHEWTVWSRGRWKASAHCKMMPQSRVTRLEGPVLDLQNPAYLQLFADGPWQLRKKIVRDKDLLMFDHLVHREPVIFDVGANKGQSIASFLSIFPEATIHAFECHPALVPVLRNLKETCADACRNVTIYDFGLGAEDGIVKFVTPIVNGVVHFEESTCKAEMEIEKHGSRYFGSDKHLAVHEFVARVRKGDDLHIAPDIIKIDTEGSEPDVLRGLLNSIGQGFPLIFAETSCYDEMKTILYPMGYRPFMPDERGRIVPVFRGNANVLYIHPNRHALFKEGSLVAINP